MLDGPLVLDFTRIFSGPFCTQILGDLGADVLKVERTEVGDESRLFGVTKGSPTPGSPFLAMNRNKRSIALDLKSAAGVDVARRLALQADVLVHNFRPGVMERLGLDYESLAAENPRLIYCEISGYGHNGPRATRAANDLQIQAYSGLLSMTGEPDGPPVRNPASVSDLTAGLYAAIGVLGALVERERSGRGQRIQTSMLGGQMNMVNYFITDFIRQGTVPRRWGTGAVLGLPNQVFNTADGAICMTSPNQAAWEATCGALDVPELALDPRFATLADRYAHRDELVAEMSAVFERFTSEEAINRLDDVGVPCAPVNSIPDVAVDEAVLATGYLVETESADGERVSLVQTPLDLSRTKIRTRRPPPNHGQDTEQVLKDLGFDDVSIKAMRDAGEVA